MMDAGEDHVLLDVRTPAENAESRIAHPRHVFIPLGKLRERLGELPRDREIVAYARRRCGLRGGAGPQGAGFGKVSFLDGGIVSWPFAVEKG
jgi:rhodanese-related sulfurtransferase